jgi:hypothetical protein
MHALHGRPGPAPPPARPSAGPAPPRLRSSGPRLLPSRAVWGCRTGPPLRVGPGLSRRAAGGTRTACRTPSESLLAPVVRVGRRGSPAPPARAPARTAARACARRGRRGGIRADPSRPAATRSLESPEARTVAHRPSAGPHPSPHRPGHSPLAASYPQRKNQPGWALDGRKVRHWPRGALGVPVAPAGGCPVPNRRARRSAAGCCSTADSCRGASACIVGATLLLHRLALGCL